MSPWHKQTVSTFGLLALLSLYPLTGTADWQLLDKNGTKVCRALQLAKGFGCGDPYCDRKELNCQSYTADSDSPTYAWSPNWVGNDRWSTVSSDGEFVLGITDDNNKLRLKYLVSSTVVKRGSECVWENASTVPPYRLICPGGSFISAVSCADEACSSTRIWCCAAVYSETPSVPIASPEDDGEAEAGVDGGSIRP